MGSSRNLKPKGQPRQILSSKEFGVYTEYSDTEGFGGGGKSDQDPFQLVAELVLINPDVHDKTEPGDHLFVKILEDRIEVITSIGRLGNISAHDKSIVIKKRLRVGTVIEIKSGPRKAIVKLEA